MSAATTSERPGESRIAGPLASVRGLFDPSRMYGRLKGAMRDPLFAFLLIGAGFFLAYYLIEAGRSEPVRYTKETERALVEEFELIAGRKANEKDRAKLQKDYVDDELLFREAVDRGMYLTDSQTRKRLTDKVRYLIAGAPPEPTEEQLIDYYSGHLSLYRAEPRITFSQVFFSAEPRSPALTLAALNRGEMVQGDDFWLGRDFPQYGESMVRGIFGQPFIETLRKAKPGDWFGPVKSPRGWHFVRKDESLAAEMMPYAAIRDQVRQDFMNAHTNEAIDREVAKLKEKFDVEIDP